jgi:hypothetical protein
VTGEVRERSGAPAIATEPHRGHESRRLLLGLMRLGVYVIEQYRTVVEWLKAGRGAAPR